MKIPMAEPDLQGNELQNVRKCIEAGWISSLGTFIKEFEDKFSSFCGAKYGIATSSGTTSLHLALATLGISKGDEVIIPTLTHICCCNMVTLTGAKPVLVDSEESTWNIDVNKIKEKITKKTKAIMPVHLYGHPVDMDPILDLAEDHDLLVIVDSAEAHGAEYKGRKVGGIGDVECFSFYANKIITTGEGGMIVTNNEEWNAKAKKLRDQGYEAERRFLHRELGFNYRMTNLQAALGVAQMERIEEFVRRRRKNAEIYTSLLADTVGIATPPEAKWAKNVYWMYRILVEDDFGLSAGQLMEYLNQKGIATRPVFYPIHKQPLYSRLFRKQRFPIAEEVSRKGINLPSGNTLTEEQIRYVCRNIKSAIGK